MEPVETVLARRDRLATALAAEVAAGGAALTGPACARLAEAALKALPPGARYDAAYRSACALLGTAPTPQVLNEFSWALAGGVALLRAGTPAYPPQLPREPAPAVLRVAACRRLPAFRKDDLSKTRVRYRGRVVSGPGTPLVVEWAWTAGFVGYLASRPDGLGFARFGKGGRPYQHYSTLVGMRLAAELSAGPDGRPVLGAVWCTPSLQGFNRALTEMRFRSTFTCPFAFTHPCHHCPKGQGSCPAAVRPLDLVERRCPGCGQESQFDPAWPAEQCVRCAQSGRKL